VIGGVDFSPPGAPPSFCYLAQCRTISVVTSFCPDFVARWLYNGGVTSGLIHRENGRRFLTPFVCAGCLLTGWKAACSRKSRGVRLHSARAKAAFHPVSRQTHKHVASENVSHFRREWLHRYRVTVLCIEIYNWTSIHILRQIEIFLEL